MKIATVVAMAVVSVGLVGCAKQDKAAGSAATKEATQAASAARAQTECPVRGDKIDKSAFVDYQGKRVYFCCADCIAEFNKDPDKYMKKLADQGVTLEVAPAGAGSATKETVPAGSGTKDEGSGTK